MSITFFSNTGQRPLRKRRREMYVCALKMQLRAPLRLTKQEANKQISHKRGAESAHSFSSSARAAKIAKRAPHLPERPRDDGNESSSALLAKH